MAKKLKSLDKINHGQSDSIISDSFTSNPLQNVKPKVRYDNVPLELLDPAPAKWNFFSKHSEEKINEMYFSIKDNGQYEDINIWEQENGRFIILAGHTRTEIFKKLYENEGEKYSKISAKIYRYDTLTNDQARQMIIDTNWVSRDLTRKDRHLCILQKYEILSNGSKKTTDEKKRTIIADDLGITSRQVHKYYTIAKKLSPQFKELYLTEKISIENAYNVAIISSELQEWILNTYPNKLKHKYLSKIKADMTKEQIKLCFTDKIKKSRNLLNNGVKKIVNTLSDEDYQSLRSHLNEWLKRNGHPEIE